MELAKQRRLAIGDHLNHEAAESPEQLILRLAEREARERRQGPRRGPSPQDHSVDLAPPTRPVPRYEG